MHERCEELMKLKMAVLMDLAKCLQVVGRHDMKKEILVNAIALAEQLKNSATIIEEVIVSDFESELAADAGESGQWEQQLISSGAAEKSAYVDNAKIGQLVAFRVNEKKALSGKIVEIHQALFMVETKNKVKFSVRKKNIMWVKTGDRWPRGVYLALKGEHPNGTNKAAN